MERMTAVTGQQKDLPAKVHYALSRILHACAEQMTAPVNQSLSALRDDLPLLIGREASKGREIVLFSHCKRLSSNWQRLLPALLAHIERDLSSIRDEGDDGNTRPATRITSSQWTLSDTDNHAHVENATDFGRVVNECRLPLYLLGQRFGVLAESAAFDTDAIPIGPKKLVDALTEASREVFGEDFPHGLLASAIAQKLFRIYPSLVNSVNTELDRASILPGLTFVPSLKRNDTATATPPMESGLSGDPAGYHDASQGPGAREHFVQAVATPDFAQMQALLARAKGRTPWSLSAGMDSQSALSGSVVASLIDEIPSRDTSGRPLGIRQLQDELNTRAKAVHGPDAHLTGQLSGSIELLGMLFDAICRDVHKQSRALELLTRLQVPLMRMAVSSQGFFEEDSHPGRQIMNRVAESGATIDDDNTSVDVRFDTALKNAVERVENEYRGDEAVLRGINSELSVAHEQQVMRSEAIEQRHVETARGQERLAIAREAARSLLDERIGARRLPAHTNILLRTAWQDALTFIRLRNEPHTDTWKRHDRLTNRIIGIAEGPDPIVDIDLRESITAILKRTGYHIEDAAEVGHALSRSAAAPNDPGRMPMTHLVVVVKTRPRFGESGMEAQQIETLSSPRTPAEEECFQRMRNLPFGCALDFVINQQGDVRRRRLSWYSQVTGNALLVNRQGARVGEMQLDQLARLMAAGQVRVAEKTQASLFDRAWMATKSTLESFGKLLANPVQPVAS